MSFDSITELLTLLLGFTGLASFIGGFFLWYKGAVEKRYAAERAFAHIRADIQQLGELMKTIDDDIQAVERTLLEHKGQLQITQQQIAWLGTKMTDGSTGGWQRKLPE